MHFDLIVENARVATCDGPEEASPRERRDVRDRAAAGGRGGRVAFVGGSEARPGDLYKVTYDGLWHLTGDAWAEDPGCYLSDDEIGVIGGSERIPLTPYRRPPAMRRLN